jgi:endonuclease/exonuclease/phosphatase family metal-dependent hydrolase
MCRTVLCCVLAPLSTLALLTVLAWPLAPAAVAHAGAAARHGAPTVTARRTRHILVYGSLMDSQPWHDQWLKVYTKTHQTNHYVEMMRSTVVKVKTKVVPRAALRKGMYVIVTCQRVGGKLQAITVHIEYRHPRRKRSS